MSDFATNAHLAALKNRVEKSLIAASGLCTSAPDTRVATDADHPDPTADIVLHPKRMAVSNAFTAAVSLHTALQITQNADDILGRLDHAIEAWHGRDSE